MDGSFSVDKLKNDLIVEVLWYINDIFVDIDFLFNTEATAKFCKFVSFWKHRIYFFGLTVIVM